MSESPKQLFYVSTGRGCAIYVGRNANQVRRNALRDVGTMCGVNIVRPATDKDIAWVRGMGGYVPPLPTGAA